MKKIVILIILIFCFFLTSCGGEEKITVDGFEFSSRVYNDIIKEAEQKGYEISPLALETKSVIRKVAGKYNKAYVIMIDTKPNYDGHMYDFGYEIADILFENENSGFIKVVYYKGKIYTLKEAYNEDILSKKDIEDIYLKFYRASPYEDDYNYMRSQYAEITPQLYYWISQKYYEQHNLQINKESLINESYSLFGRSNIDGYAENNIICTTILIEPNDKSEVLYETVNDLEFKFFKGYKLIIYKDGICYSLQEAFDKGILSEKGLNYIYERNQNVYDKQW